MEDKKSNIDLENANMGFSESENSTPGNSGTRKKDDSLLIKIKQLAYYELRESGYTSQVSIAGILGISTRTATRYKEYFDANPEVHEKLLPNIRHWKDEDFYSDGKVIMIDIIKRIISNHNQFGSELTETEIKLLNKKMKELEQPEPIGEKEIKDLVPVYISKTLRNIAERGDYEKKASVIRLHDEIMQELPKVMSDTPLWLARAELQYNRKEHNR